MGMFDYIEVLCELPLEVSAVEEYWGGLFFQTKDTPKQLMSNYRVDTQGYLEERVETNVYERCYFSGDITFYQSYPNKLKDLCGWLEFRALFYKGTLVGEVHLVEHTSPRDRTEKEKLEIWERKQEVKNNQEKRLQKKMDIIKEAKTNLQSLQAASGYIYDKMLAEIKQKKESHTEELIFDYVFNDFGDEERIKTGLNPF